MALSTIDQNSLGSGVAGNGPAFSAQQSSGQAVSSATYQQVSFQTKLFDTNGCFNNTNSSTTLNGVTAPAYSFAPNVAGYYQVCVGVGNGSSTRELIWVYKNGTAYYQFGDSGTANVNQLSGSGLLYLNGISDYIHAYVYLGTGSTLGTGYNTYFSASLVRAA